MVIRVLIICDQPFWGGEIATRNIIKHLGPGYICDRKFGNDAIRNAEANHYDLIYIHCVWGGLLQTLEKDLKRLRTDNINIKILGGIRGEAGFQGNKEYLYMLDGVNTNNLERLDVMKTIREDTFLCHSAVDTDIFKPMDIAKTHDFTIVWVGDIGKKVKNWDIIPELGYHYKIATKPEWVDVDPNAEYYEYEDMPMFYNTGDIFVFPSLSEGSPQPPMEAMACGLPVLAFRTAGAVVEYLDDFQLVDSMEEMKEKLGKLKDDENLRRQLGANNRRIILREWSWKVKIKQYREFFEHYVVRNMNERMWEVWHGKDSQGGEKYFELWGDPRDIKKWGSGKEYRLKMAADLQIGMSALDVGCGIGHLCYLLKDSIEYAAVDNSDDQLKVARKMFPGVRFKSADIYDLSNEQMADTVYCLSVLIHLPDLENPLRQLWSRAERCLIFNVTTIPMGLRGRLMVLLSLRDVASFNLIDIDPNIPGVIYNRYTKEYVLNICHKLPGVKLVEVYEGGRAREKGKGLTYFRVIRK